MIHLRNKYNNILEEFNMDFDKLKEFCNNILEDKPIEDIVLLNSDEIIHKLINEKFLDSNQGGDSLVPAKTIYVNILLNL